MVIRDIVNPEVNPGEDTNVGNMEVNISLFVFPLASKITIGPAESYQQYFAADTRHGRGAPFFFPP